MDLKELLDLPAEMREECMLKMPFSDLLHFCSASKELRTIGEKDTFWRRKTHADFPGTRKRVSPSMEDTWKEEYKTLSAPLVSLSEVLTRLEKIDGRWWMYHTDQEDFQNFATYEALKDHLVNSSSVDFAVGDFEAYREHYNNDYTAYLEESLMELLLDRHIMVGRAWDRLIEELR